jgi:DNA-binding transcriptional regulator YiaG
MPNIATALREEVDRLARKEIRLQTEALRKASTEYRKKIAEMRREISGLQKKVAVLEKKAFRDIASQVSEAGSTKIRYTAKGLRSNRKRLGLSASDFGKLIGVTGQTVYKWEQEKTRPREGQIQAIAAVRGMGKKEARFRLEELAKEGG